MKLSIAALCADKLFVAWCLFILTGALQFVTEPLGEMEKYVMTSVNILRLALGVYIAVLFFRFVYGSYTEKELRTLQHNGRGFLYCYAVLSVTYIGASLLQQMSTVIGPIVYLGFVPLGLIALLAIGVMCHYFWDFLKHV